MLVENTGDLLSEGQLRPPTQDLGVAKTNVSQQDTTPSMDALYEAYIAHAGENVVAWLTQVRGGSIVLSNAVARCARLDLDRAVLRLSAVAGHASQLMPPPAHRKASRRERQGALRAGLQEERTSSLARILGCCMAGYRLPSKLLGPETTR